jgi:APA family basic amino acid/polyamine antiporter
MVPLVSSLGVIVCTSMIFVLDATTLKVAFGWMALGLIVYFVYSKKRSKLQNPSDIIPKASDFEKH